MNDDLVEGQVDDDEGEDDEWEVDERLLPAELNGPLRFVRIISLGEGAARGHEDGATEAAR